MISENSHGIGRGRGGSRPGAGRKPGSANKKTREIADRAAQEHITPLEVLLNSMRYLWTKAHEGTSPDLELAKDACVIANQAAPYCHPRLAAVAHNLAPDSEVVIVTGVLRPLDDPRPTQVVDHEPTALPAP